MIKRILFLLTFTICSQLVILANELRYKDYDWAPEPKLHVLNEKDKALPEIILLEKQAVEFLYNKAGDLEEFKLYHVIIRVNSDEAIERNNRLYIPSNTGLEFLKQKARIISPNGKVKELSDQNIKEGEDEKTKNKYKYFAIEGIQLGCEIEYFYLIRVSNNLYGSRERIQGTEPKHNEMFELISPLNLHFVTKSFNDLPEMSRDTTVDDRIVLFLKMDVVPALPEEDLSTHSADVMQVVYKLNSNSANNSKDITSYGGVSSNIYKSFMAPAEKSVQSKVKKFVGTLPIKFAKDDEDKIRIIEDYIKNNFNVIENETPSLSELPEIIQKKNANSEGIIKLFAAVFNELNIDYQIVLTSDRSYIRFDQNFEAYNFLTDYLIYIPSVGSYLSPTLILSRLGFPPPHLTMNYGLFIKKVTLNDFETGVGKIKFIEPTSFDKNYDDVDVTIKFATDMSNPVVSLKRQFGGYYAENIQPYYSYFTEEDKKKTTNDLLKDFIPNTEIKEIAVENAGKDYFPSKPLILNASFTCENLVENSGGKYLFKIGELIGPQVEMYQKEERKAPIESSFARCYRRHLFFEVPAGYKVSNLEALNINVFCEEDGKKTIAFTSDYKLEGNLLTINVDEYYKKIRFPVNEYENYRKVVNASANFNKINLFLEKTK